MVEDQPGREMQADVEECEQPKHAPQSRQCVPVRQSSKRRDAEGDEQETQCPQAGHVLDFLDGIGTEVVAEGTHDQQNERYQGQREDGGFQVLAEIPARPGGQAHREGGSCAIRHGCGA